MASDYQAISAYNEENLGKDRASRKSQVEMYTDPVHFVFELLQNADDAEATWITFTVEPTCLIIEHNGIPFTESNVKSISYFEKSDKDDSGAEITKTGHFGLGFKSVFSYTASPQIASGVESFEIVRLYSVQGLPYPSDLDSAITRFVLPFNHFDLQPDFIDRKKWKASDVAYKEISTKLKNLGSDTLLFTKCLNKIRWRTQAAQGVYQRYQNEIVQGGCEVSIKTGESQIDYYLIFDRPICWKDEEGNTKHHRPVQIAFRLDKSRTDGGVIISIKNATLFVLFPTTKETHVGFLLQGPYRTNPSRGNVFVEDDFNKYLGRFQV